MADNSKIEWTTHTFNPWWGCTKVSPECDSCYAETGAIRYGWSETGSHFPIWGKDAQRRFFKDAHWNNLIKWNEAAKLANERHRVFCGSYCDILEDRPDLDEHRARLATLAEHCLHLNFLFLSKRPQNFRRMFPLWRDGFPSNVWAMTTVGCNSSLWRVDALREVPARIRGLSIEPLLEDLGTLNLDGIHWVIVGGESGHGARPMDLAWVRDIVQQCKTAGVACFVKQLGAFPVSVDIRVPNLERWRIALNDRKGGDMLEWSEDLRVRQFPEAR